MASEDDKKKLDENMKYIQQREKGNNYILYLTLNLLFYYLSRRYQGVYMI